MLSDDKKRSLYDQYGEAGVKSTVGGPSSAYTVLHQFLFFSSFSISFFFPFFPDNNLEKSWHISVIN